MNTPLIIILSMIAGIGVGMGAYAALIKVKRNNRKRRARDEAQQILGKARSEASKIERDCKQKAKELETRMRKSVEGDISKQRQRLKQEEQRIKEKESQLEKQYKRKETLISEKERDVSDRSEKVKIAEKRLSEKEAHTGEYLEQLRAKLEGVANMSSEQARQELVNALEEEAKVEAAKRISVLEEEARAESEKRAKRVISMAISRYSGEYSAERTVSVVALPSDEVKGKIIGREGRNIRALEAACGVDLIVDDTPEAVVISGFDPVRREVARRSLERLIEDGRIHPARIEEVIEKTKSELFKSIKEDGEKAAFELGIHGLHNEIVKLIGSLKYRTSYTQNNYTHSIEVGFLAGMMASELGADVRLARRAGFLHDIGKALDHSIEGSHAIIGAEFAKRHGEVEAICHAIRSHHEDEKPNSVIAHLVQAADALSSARPGARRSMMESYVRRLEDLESIANSFDGVVRSFAVQAGREIRVVVEGSKVTDEQSLMLSRDIARKIENELSYPGQIKVTVMRETRAIEHAR